MKWDAIIFDLDGVIVHTDMYHYQAWKMLADAIKAPFNEDVNNRLRGVSRMQSLEIILEQYSGKPLSTQDKEALANRKDEAYRQNLAKLSPTAVSIEVRATLERIKRSGMKTAIGSSSRNAPMILKQIGLSDWFDAVSDGNRVSHSKPHPEVFLNAAAMLHVSNKSCIVVEDALSGIEAGIAAGMATAAIGDAARYGIADYHLDTFSDLTGILHIE
jgi:beta-phosphoglucomutase